MPTLPENRIYLASRSLRRRELLKQIGVNFEMLLLREGPRRISDLDETPQEGELPIEYARRIARAKVDVAQSKLALRKLPPLPVLAADTVVALDKTIFGKPQNAEEAEIMLRALSGKTHRVLTVVAVASGQKMEMRLSDTTVRFRALADREIALYLAGGEGADKAGGYAIQGMAAVFIEEICGSYSGVMGLPLFETASLLQEFGIEIL